MSSIQHILFPFDFSEAGSRAANYIGPLANRLHAKVTLLSVVPPIWNEPLAGMGPVIVQDPDELNRQLQTRLNQTFGQEFAGLEVDRIAVTGDPAVEITAFAHNQKVDLIMMPTHGFGLFRSLLLGSVTAKVLHDSHCPVWTSAHAEKQDAPHLPNKMLCAIDGTPESIGVLRWASQLSSQLGASLNLLHVVAPASDLLALESERDLQESLREAARERVETFIKAAAVEAPLRVAVGDVAPTIAEEARQEGAHLLLLGRGSLQSKMGRLRTHEYGIIQSSPCPVISV